MSKLTEKQTELVDNVIMYGFNFEHKFIFNVWDGAIAEHLQSKFSNIYTRYGASAAMFVFYTQLDGNNREILINYINNLKK